jgi:hypothetical protein
MSIALRENWGVSHKVHRLAIDTELCYSFYLYESATVNLIISLAILQPTLTQSHDQLPASSTRQPTRNSLIAATRD